MYELVQVTDRTYYINCPAKIGVVRVGENGVILIDSGSDKDAGKKVYRTLEQNGWKLLSILNTHSHADHIGGNRYLQNQTGCKIFASRIESAFTNHPILEPVSLYGGCPPKALRHKFLLAQESAASDFSDPAFPREIEVIPLPGHSFDMVGFRTPGNVVFLGDCVSSQSTLEKYGVSFLYDVEALLKTLDAVEAMEAAMFVPAHAEAVQDIRELVDLNRNKVHEIGDKLVSICRKPSAFDAILREIFREYNLTMTFEQHALVGSTVRSYLAWLMDSGRITAEIQDDTLVWSAL